MKKNITNQINTFLWIGLLLFFHSACKKEHTKTPVLTTNSISNVSENSANCGGNITSDGGANVTVRGVCWSKNPLPTINDYKTTDGVGIGHFTSIISNLTPNTKYFVRAYASNSSGTGYGENRYFITKGGITEIISDIDGNKYKTVNIDGQVWMAENLKVTRFNNGDTIVSSNPISKDISNENTPQYQWAYNGIEDSVSKYGRLYTWYVVIDNRKICPSGWHVPTDDEWSTLTEYLGESAIAGGKLKEAGLTNWKSPNVGATNETEFNALPAGTRYFNGAFYNLHEIAYWWTSTASNTGAWSYYVNYYNAAIYRFNYYKASALSVRCIKN